jgi:hypothetical protein
MSVLAENTALKMQFFIYVLRTVGITLQCGNALVARTFRLASC